MIVFLDTPIVVYIVERSPVWGPLAMARVSTVRAAGDRLGISDLVRMECLVGPLKRSHSGLLAAFNSFFSLPDVQVFSITSAVCDRAAGIRATHNFKPVDSLHLATAVEHGCGLFLTHDHQLARFTGIPVEVLT